MAGLERIHRSMEVDHLLRFEWACGQVLLTTIDCSNATELLEFCSDTINEEMEVHARP